MRTPRPLPPELVDRPFHRREAIALGVTPRMLQHPRLVEVMPSVYQRVDLVLEPRAWLQAARLSLPADAGASHLTRLLDLGLEVGPLFPLRFTIGRDHHLAARPGLVFLHRTVRMPPRDADGVALEAALVGAASVSPLVDVVAVADWLVHRGLLDLRVARDFVEAERWRPGTVAAADALRLVDPRSRSIPESTVRCLLVAAGLPRPESNLDVHDEGGRFLATGDLVYPALRLVVEHEGGHHRTDAVQFERDVHRCAGLRRGDWAYVQSTPITLRSPRALVLRIHQAMVERGYAGPPPRFEAAWHRLLEVPAPHEHRRRSVDPQPHGRRVG